MIFVDVDEMCDHWIHAPTAYGDFGAATVPVATVHNVHHTTVIYGRVWSNVECRLLHRQAKCSCACQYLATSVAMRRSIISIFTFILILALSSGHVAIRGISSCYHKLIPSPIKYILLRPTILRCTEQCWKIRQANSVTDFNVHVKVRFGQATFII